MGGIILVFSVIIWVMSEYPKSPDIDARYSKMLINLEYSYNSRVQSAKRRNADNNVIHQLTQNFSIKRKELIEKRNTEVIKYSFIGRIGGVVEPVLRPLGFSWQMGVSLITGIAAKEIVVSTLGVLYNATSGDETDVQGNNLLEQELQSSNHGITPLIAFTFMLFVLLYIPCMATIIAIGKEIGWNWALFSIGYNTILTWSVCFITYNIGSLLGFG
jgi:ferrous iron transport protein B